MPDKNRPPDKVDDHGKPGSTGGAGSSRPGKRSQHRPQIPLPFTSASGSVVLSEREQLNAVLSSLPIILFILDRQANFTMLEGKGVALIAPTRQSLVGRRFFDFYPENSETRRHLTEALDGTAVSWTERLGDHVFMTTLTPVRDHQDSVTGLLGIGIELTNNTPAAGSGESVHQSVGGAPPLKNQFFHLVSHELRSPLNSIVGFANLLLKHSKSHLDEQDLSYLHRITGNATHLLGVVGDMMDLAMVETGKAKVAKSEVDVSELVRETIAEFGSGSIPGSVELRIEIPDDVRPIETDRQKLKQVLINLLANAMKFTQKGSVVISVGVDEFLRPFRIDVRDTGIGISADNLEAIFEAFERGERVGNQEIEGMGLGLTISRTLCDLLGYTLRVVSEPGKGSTFTIDVSQSSHPHSR